MLSGELRVTGSSYERVGNEKPCLDPGCEEGGKVQQKVGKKSSSSCSQQAARSRSSKA